MRSTYIFLTLGYILCLPVSTTYKREFSIDTVKEWKNTVKNNIAERLLRDPKVWDSVVDNSGDEESEIDEETEEGHVENADVDVEVENITEEFPLGRYNRNGRYNRGAGASGISGAI